MREVEGWPALNNVLDEQKLIKDKALGRLGRSETEGTISRIDFTNKKNSNWSGQE